MTQMASITCAGCKHQYADTALFCPNCGRPKARQEVSDPLIGKVLGERFQIIEPLGQGGSGTIYRAEHVTLRRKVAIKVLHTELSRDDLAVERFRREATTVAEIDNEHIVEIHDFGRTADGRLYLAMELLEGETLDSVLAREHQLSVERVADILIQVGEALMEAHAIGYVHRDLRPRNIYLAVRRGRANFVKLLDFGLAKLVETDAQAASTSLGMTFGDPRYMSPEQARGDRIDRRADIYQLGCVAYEMLTGSPPFTGSRVFDILTKQVTEVPAPLPTKRPGVPLWMEAAVAKMLAKDPENRFATTTRMVEALRRGIETGEVMEDTIARRRESIPPPSVSRVMQKMGIASPADQPVQSQKAAELPKLPPSPVPPAPAPAPAPQNLARTVSGYESASPGFAAVAQSAPGFAPHNAPAFAPGGQGGAPAMPPPLEAAPAHAAPASERRRTGTPEVGVPTVDVQAPVTGVIDAPVGRAKRASQGPTQDPSVSQVWYEDDDVDPRAKKSSRDPGTTDLSLYDEPVRGKRWPLLIGVLAFLAVGGTIAFALTHKSEPSKSVPPVATAPVAAPPPTDVPPSTVIDNGSAAAATGSGASAIVAKGDKHPAPTTTHTGGGTATNTGGGTTTKVPDKIDFSSSDDLAKRRPGGPNTTTTTTTNPTNPTNPTNVVVTNPPPKDPKSSDPSGADGPQDPYGGGNTTVSDPGDGAAPDKKAEFYANLGQQQLASGDTAGAAASFKKANELDAKNVASVIGMGQIALRQGLFGDAIAHLRKAAKLSPRSSQVFTLLGDAYLGAGQNATAADNYKKALQLDPDNARARDGFNEASSRVPPPSDDN
ncbi:MAG: protein kinase [Deltaproteobacteria bacterium]|nr:protein kinase [Deltaproteobacteria bacterium]